MKNKTPPELPLLEKRFGGRLPFVDFSHPGISAPHYAQRRIETGLENVVRVLSNGKTFPLLAVVDRVEFHKARSYHDIPVDGWYTLAGVDLNGRSHQLLLEIPEQTGGLVGHFMSGEKKLSLFGWQVNTNTLYHEVGHGLYTHLFQPSDRMALRESFSGVYKRLLKRLSWGARLGPVVEDLGMTFYGSVSSSPPKRYEHLYVDRNLVLKVNSRRKLSPEEADALKSQGIEQRTVDEFSVLRKDPEEAFAESFAFYMRSRMLNGTGIPTRSIGKEGRDWYATVKQVIEHAVERSLS